LDEVAVRKTLTIALLAAAGMAQAEIRYVTDQLETTLRTGESVTHRITRMLTSGTPVEVVSSNPGTGYSKVRTQDGKEGFILTRQLMTEPVARERLAEIEERMKELQQAPDQLSAKLATLQGEHTALKNAYGQLESVKRDLEAELIAVKRAAADPLAIAEERNALRKQVADFAREVEELRAQNREIANQRDQRWFMIGGGVALGGLLLGLILPHLRLRRQRSSWSTL
jgi:SH3 domain protein